MATKVLEINLENPVPQLSTAELQGYATIRALVKRRGVPIGQLVLPTSHIDELATQLEHEFARLGEITNLFEGQLPLVSVVVCTRNRPEQLKTCLASLCQLDYPKLEILIVDNAPSDNRTGQVVEAYPQFRYVLEPRPGLDWARNRGIKEASGDIIAYTDDDVRVDPLWVRGLVEAFAAPQVMAVTGLVAPAELETEAQELFELYGGFGRGFKQQWYTAAEQASWYYFPLNTGLFGTGANMAYRRRFFEKHGSFDEALDVGTLSRGAGDLDMFYRVVRAGYALVYQPKALIWHYHRRDYRQLKQQLGDFGCAYFAFLTKAFINDPPKRLTVIRWTGEWLVRWYAKRLVRPRGLPRALILAEIFGSICGPVSYWLARRQAAKIRRKFEDKA